MENLKLTKPWNTLNTRKNDLNRSNSTSLGFDVRNLQYMKQLYKNFPKANAVRSELSWTHYRQLCTCVTRASGRQSLNVKFKMENGKLIRDLELGTWDWCVIRPSGRLSLNVKFKMENGKLIRDLELGTWDWFVIRPSWSGLIQSPVTNHWSRLI